MFLVIDLRLLDLAKQVADLVFLIIEQFSVQYFAYSLLSESLGHFGFSHLLQEGRVHDQGSREILTKLRQTCLVKIAK